MAVFTRLFLHSLNFYYPVIFLRKWIPEDVFKKKNIYCLFLCLYSGNILKILNFETFLILAYFVKYGSNIIRWGYYKSSV